MHIEFCGAAREVTGSCHLVHVGGRRILLDCGLIQGRRADEDRNREPFPFVPAEIDAVVLSHAHIDHSGRLPLLARQGFDGPVYTHRATRDLCRIMLRDSAFISEKDTEWENRRRARAGLPPREPLYTQDDAEAVMKQFRDVAYGQPADICPGVRLTLHDAGHILGSAVVSLELEEGGERSRVVFSGDLGHRDAPILRDPERLDEADLVILESTYGDRRHRTWDDTRDEIIDIVASASEREGNILIPAFAVGRSQLILYWLARHFEEAKLERWRIFLDSPLAIRATAIYGRYPELYDREAGRFWSGRDHESALPNLAFSRTADDSRALNSMRSGAIIIAGSGMCTGGRIRHHLLHNLWREECHVIIVGFQAAGTTGRLLVDGARRVKLLGQSVRVAATVHTVGGLSAHADQRGLADWYGAFRGRPPVALVHGEPDAMDALAGELETHFGAAVTCVQRGQKIELGGRG
ncbi:MBL fold metallo-hydrolase RNA specificity domain-containing protein [Lentisalinibacter orientalis]|uniref:MBL fold metallo-hydrolase RNA specificity domain-containing protein n=1 Tax=Lentisalinibacter orientalis TaxID=2992241 RepID=UPI00386D87EB